MKILKDTLLFGLFASYADGVRNGAEKLSAAYDDFAMLLATLPTDGTSICAQLRRLFYTKIELKGVQDTVSMNETERHVLFDVYISKTLALLDAEEQMMKEMLRYGGTAATELKEEAVCRNGKKGSVTLTWNGTDSDLIELVAALMSAGAIGTAEGRKLTVADVVRVFEEMFHLKINALYTKRGKVFDRCTDTTPFIDSLRKSYNQMLDKRLA
ncbi:RteC domain-containing protein [Bacteroides clarus]|uniref:RteC protein n=1 Tax=Bacteroides clarus TaxID=626929 RepID=A0A1Y3YX98_9BACE|nr:RteC domain-containing protein [Bacteroides clarus]OUN98930.1 RteC protein [Bacteroides clarus]